METKQKLTIQSQQ